MQQRLTYLTLGVDDLSAMTQWYNQVFGWTPHDQTDGVTFYKLNGIMLGLFPAEELAKDAGVPHDGKGFKRFSMSINFTSDAEVDRHFSQAVAQGAQAVKQPQKVFWGGYSGYLSDPEGNLWELAHNPFLQLDDEGNVLA